MSVCGKSLGWRLRISVSEQPEGYLSREERGISILVVEGLYDLLGISREVWEKAIALRMYSGYIVLP